MLIACVVVNQYVLLLVHFFWPGTLSREGRDDDLGLPMWASAAPSVFAKPRVD